LFKNVENQYNISILFKNVENQYNGSNNSLENTMIMNSFT